MARFSLLVLLPLFLTLVPVGAEGNRRALIRHKRSWITAPRKLFENQDYTGYSSIARIRSDKENFTKIFYSLTGPGVDDPPVGVFGINRDSGFVKIYSILDREEIAFYHLQGVAHFTNGSLAEKNIPLTITVEDENDCSPVIEIQQIGYVKEASAAGTAVMRVRATDADQPNHRNSQLYYKIVQQGASAGLFYIDAYTGDIMVKQNTLDREKQASHKVMIEVSDLNGQEGGNKVSGEVEIKLIDINDNIPYLEKETYEGSVEENTINQEVMRIKAIDMDQSYTNNWWAKYTILSGNEVGYFTIVTDNKTNEGVIMIQKALDYEELKVLNLQVAVSNMAEYNFGAAGSGGTTSTKSYPIKINVVNQKEGPRFQPGVKVVSVSEDHSSIVINKVIDNYAATDSDTLKTATNVRYVKIRDVDNWLTIDEKTADIKLNKLPDRESKFLRNGTYFAEIICITKDSPSKTATGTIAVQVEDFNDHCPKLTATTHTMCLGDNVIYVTAADEDESPNSAPFEFHVISGRSSGQWTVEHYNETTVVLRDNADLWPGIYKVAVEVKDQQGKSCDAVQMADVVVCTCVEGTKTCVARRTKTTALGAAGILLPLLGLLLLLLVPLLLLFCLCGGAAAGKDFKPIPFYAKEQLIPYHTEGQGEDKEVPLMTAPVEVDHGGAGTININTLGGKSYFGGLGAGGAAAAGGAAMGGGFSSSVLTRENMQRYSQYRQGSGHMNADYMGAGTMSGREHHFSTYRAEADDGMALSDQFLEEYYSSKANHAAQQSQEKDGLLLYDYEGQGSLAGSVGCCSLLENEGDLAFLDDIGLQFKTLAEICQGKTLMTKSEEADLSVPAPIPVSPVWPSTHTHTETFRDRDNVNINTLNTTNVVSGSSTIIREEHLTDRAQSTALQNVHVQDNVVIPNQTLLVQQPAMYYAATPMYVVDPKPQVVFVAGGAQQAVGQVGVSQGLVQVGGLQGSQGLVLVDRQVGMGGGAAQAAQSASQGTMSKSRKVLLVENGSLGGEHSAHLGQGFVQVGQGATVIGGLQGSQGMVLVDRQVGIGGGAVQAAQSLSSGSLSRSSIGSPSTRSPQGFVQTGQGSTEHGLEVRGQDVHMTSHSSLLRSHEDLALTATPKAQSGQRVVVQRKKVSVTERNI